MRSKLLKIPPITDETKLLSFDIESNGLHGQAFAIGALIVDNSGKVFDEFIARVDVQEEIDEWVAKNVLPAMDNIHVTHGSYEDMREAFWRWFVKAQEKSDYTLVSNGYPVEYRFLLDCQQADLEERYWQHPFPIIDVTSLLLTLREFGEPSKQEILRKVQKNGNFKTHNPYDDAKVTALIACEAFKAAGRIND